MVDLQEKVNANGQQLAVRLANEADEPERQLLLNWAHQLIAIRDSNLSAFEKAQKAITATVESKAIIPFVNTVGREIKRLGWDERGWSGRIGFFAAAFAAILLPGTGAGIAALGGAIGVPLWVVFGAGGAFAGVLIDELTRIQRPGLCSSGDIPGRMEGEVIDQQPYRRDSNDDFSGR